MQILFKGLCLFKHYTNKTGATPLVFVTAGRALLQVKQLDWPLLIPYAVEHGTYSYEWTAMVIHGCAKSARAEAALCMSFHYD